MGLGLEPVSMPPRFASKSASCAALSGKTMCEHTMPSRSYSAWSRGGREWDEAEADGGGEAEAEAEAEAKAASEVASAGRGGGEGGARDGEMAGLRRG